MEASLESQVEASQLPTPHNSNNFNVGFPSPPPTSSLSDSETAVSETEAAAQALERIALGTCQYSPFLGLSARNSLCQTGAAQVRSLTLLLCQRLRSADRLLPPQSWKIEPGAYTTIFASDPAVFSTCRPTWRDTLPEKVVCDCLINHFFDHLHFVFFVRKYFWWKFLFCDLTIYYVGCSQTYFLDGVQPVLVLRLPKLHR